MTKYIHIQLLLAAILFSGCLNNSIEDYDDTEDLAFYDEYRMGEDVNETSNGILYKVLETTEDGVNPGSQDIVLFDLKGEHVVTGEVVNDSYELGFPAVFPLESLLPAFNEGLQLMEIGSIYEFVFPTELTGGDGRVYLYSLELHNTQNGFMSDYAGREDVNTTDSGLMYRVIQEGEGDRPDSDSTVRMNYSGTLISGEVFDSNDNWEPQLTGLIDGFTEGVTLMQPGATYEFLIPPDLAYSNQSHGIIYPHAALLFEIDLLDILD